MAKKADLMGLGMPPLLASRMATEPTLITAAGATVGAATQIGSTQFLVSVTASTGSNAGVVLPQVGGDTGCLLGDDFIINNALSASTQSVIVYAANNLAGSVVTFSQGGTFQSGTTGVSVSAGKSMTLYPVTASTWLGMMG